MTTDPAPKLEIVSSRIFSEPRDRLFEVFAGPDELAQWWGPNGFTNEFHQFEFHSGGAWRFTMRGPDGQIFLLTKTFVEIVSPERIVLQHHQESHDFVMAMTFDEHPNGTLLTWRMVFDSAAEHAQFKDFIVQANEQNFNRLEAYLARR